MENSIGGFGKFKRKNAMNLIWVSPYNGWEKIM